MQTDMAVPGKKLQLETSAVDKTYCQPCSRDRDTLPAEAYCAVCKEFLCSNCASVHSKLKITRTHSLLHKSNMPPLTRDKGDQDEFECTEPCETHPKEFIKYFCQTHQIMNCGHCVVQSHRSCHVDVISEISKAFKDGPEYGDIDKAITRLFKDIDDCATTIEKNMKLMAEMGESEISKLKRCRDEVNNYFDEREKSLMLIIENMKKNDEAILDNLRPKCNNLKVKVVEIKNNIATHEHNNVQLFIEVKRAKKVLEVLQTALANISMQNTIHQYKFKKDSATERLMASNTGLGRVEKGVIDAQNTPSESIGLPHSLYLEKSVGKTMATGQSTIIQTERDKLPVTDGECVGLQHSLYEEKSAGQTMVTGRSTNIHTEREELPSTDDELERIIDETMYWPDGVAYQKWVANEEGMGQRQSSHNTSKRERRDRRHGRPQCKERGFKTPHNEFEKGSRPETRNDSRYRNDHQHRKVATSVSRAWNK
ncbi:uncharacterized protein LOC128212966 isoform X2 [Mya arenaria]|uniref:uncharacterized protein LOC128212966 isoform X2 n=1 Tax=Mya arenaria TaxID=6604 RepID=UPI0022E72DE9|nr:uncharacterized protein LOC128212966 isoform X2 [Mya arenaria]